MATTHLTKGRTGLGRPVCGARSKRTVATADAGDPRETPVDCKRCLNLWRCGVVLAPFAKPALGPAELEAALAGAAELAAEMKRSAWQPGDPILY